MNLPRLSNVIKLAVVGPETKEHLEILKGELVRNDYKICGMAVDIMIGQLEDLGMDAEQALYWKTLGLTHLPYNPVNATT